MKLLSPMTLLNRNLVTNVNSFDLFNEDIVTVVHFEVDTKSEWHRKEKCDVQTMNKEDLLCSILV